MKLAKVKVLRVSLHDVGEREEVGAHLGFAHLISLSVLCELCT